MKTETKNSILCSYLKLIPYKGGLLAVDGENEINEKWYACLYSTPPQIRTNNTDIDILAATKHLNLPVWELPEKNDVEKLAEEKSVEKTLSAYQAINYKKGFVDGYRAAGKSYSEEDMVAFLSWTIEKWTWNSEHSGFIYDDDIYDGKQEKESYRPFSEVYSLFLSSLHPKGAWCEVEVTSNRILYAEHQFKITSNKLNVIEWE